MLTNGCFATVWAKEKAGEKWTQVRLSQSMKDKEGKYFNDYSGFPTLVGKAHEFIQGQDIPEKGLRVKVITCGSRRRKSDKDGKWYQTDIITNMELANPTGTAETATPAPAAAPEATPADEGFMELPDVGLPDDDDLPFC